MLEFLLLCLCLPTFIIVTKLAPFMVVFLWSAALYTWFIYRKDHREALKGIWKWEAVNWVNLRPILIRWVIASFGMLAFIYFYDAERVFYIVKDHPKIIPILLVAYPLISALPQEFIFCSFFFKRYAPFFKSDRAKIIASSIVFAYAHVLYINPVAPTLSLLGGLIFALTYAKTRSLALVTIEHGLYGNSLFLVGLGWYFYGGSVVQ